jgi:hypothetical protein
MKPRSLDDFTGAFKVAGCELNYQCCPVCGSAGWNTYVNTQTGKWYCHSSKHGGGGVVEAWVGGEHRGQEILRVLHRDPAVHEWSEVELPPFHELSKAAKRYLLKRGVPLAQAKRLGLVEWEGRDRILIPYFRNGELIYWNSRAYSTHTFGPKYLAAPGKHPLYVVGEGEQVVIVEGAFDAMAVANTGRRGVALGGKNLPQHLLADLRKHVENRGVLIALDGDALGSALELRQAVLEAGGLPVVVPLPYGEDPASMTATKLEEVLSAGRDVA